MTVKREGEDLVGSDVIRELHYFAPEDCCFDYCLSAELEGAKGAATPSFVAPPVLSRLKEAVIHETLPRQSRVSPISLSLF